MIGRKIDFSEHIARFPPGIVSLTGGGGKTSLLFALGKALTASGRSVVCTTTTKMRRPEPRDWLDVAVADDPERLRASARRALFAARPPPAGLDPTKVAGYPPEAVDAMLERGLAEWIVVEADGAAGRPIKAPAAHEPVIPAGTGIVVALLGLECLGKPLSCEIAFRLAETEAATGVAPGEALTPEAIARLVRHPFGMFKNAPSGAKKMVFCNKADIAEAGAVDALVDAIRREGAGFLAGLYVGSVRRDGLACRSFPITE